MGSPEGRPGKFDGVRGGCIPGAADMPGGAPTPGGGPMEGGCALGGKLGNEGPDPY